MSTLKCILVYGNKKFTKKLNSSDWHQNYLTVTTLCGKKTQKKYGKEVHIEIDGTPIISKEQFAGVMESKSGQTQVHITIKVKQDDFVVH